MTLWFAGGVPLIVVTVLRLILDLVGALSIGLIAWCMISDWWFWRKRRPSTTNETKSQPVVDESPEMPELTPRPERATVVPIPIRVLLDSLIQEMFCEEILEALIERYHERNGDEPETIEIRVLKHAFQALKEGGSVVEVPGVNA